MDFGYKTSRNIRKKNGKNFDYPEDNFPDLDEELVKNIQEKSEYIDLDNIDSQSIDSSEEVKERVM